MATAASVLFNSLTRRLVWSVDRVSRCKRRRKRRHRLATEGSAFFSATAMVRSSRSRYTAPVGSGAGPLAVADVNGDGKLDVEVANGDDCVEVLLGNGDGTFQSPQGSSCGDTSVQSIFVADVNADFKPDVIVATESGALSVLLGNGDGTFQAPLLTSKSLPLGEQITVADFDGDGRQDVASGSVLLLGNGDGTFQPLNLSVNGSKTPDGPRGIVSGDFNCDGSPDLAVGGVTVLLNCSPRIRASNIVLNSSLDPSNFGQTITLTASVVFQGCGAPTGTVSFFDNSTSMNLGNAVLNSNSVAILQISTLGPSTHSITATYSGDTNFTTSASTALSQVVLGAAAKLSSTILNFGNETVATGSAPQIVTLYNSGDIPLTFSSVTISGANSTNFTQTNNCGSSLAGQASCTVTVTFMPNTTGTRTAAVTFLDNAPSKMQKVLLTGVGVLPAGDFLAHEPHLSDSSRIYKQSGTDCDTD